jgi:hypothetical protein
MVVLTPFGELALTGQDQELRQGCAERRRMEVFCPKCGAPLYAAVPEGPSSVSICLGCAHQRAQLRPAVQTGTTRQHPGCRSCRWCLRRPRSRRCCRHLPRKCTRLPAVALERASPPRCVQGLRPYRRSSEARDAPCDPVAARARRQPRQDARLFSMTMRHSRTKCDWIGRPPRSHTNQNRCAELSHASQSAAQRRLTSRTA